MARPRLGEEERRGRTVGVRVTEAEAEELRVRLAAELRLGAAELRELNRIGVNLNQMARAINAGAVAGPGTREVVERVGELVTALLAGEAE